MAHRCIEWDGWEEGLVEDILGPMDEEDDWFREWEEPDMESPTVANPDMYGLDFIASKITLDDDHDSDAREGVTNGGNDNQRNGEPRGKGTSTFLSSVTRRVPDEKLEPQGIVRKKGLATKVVEEEKAKEKHLGPGGDFCGGIGGELGRRLEAWLHQNQHPQVATLPRIDSPALSKTVSFGE